MREGVRFQTEEEFIYEQANILTLFSILIFCSIILGGV